MGVKKSVVCRSRPPPNGMTPASSRVSMPLRKPSAGSGASPRSTCSRSPGANLEAQPAFVEYFVSLMRVRSSIAEEYTPALLPAWARLLPPLLSFPRKREVTAPEFPHLQPEAIYHFLYEQAQTPGSTMCTK